MSTHQVNEDDLNLQGDMDKLEAAVAKVRKADDGTARKDAEKEARALLNQVKSTNNKFRVAVNRLEDVTARSSFNRNYSKYDEKLRGYDKELRNLAAGPKNPRGAAAAASSGARKPQVSFEEKRNEEIMGEGGKDGLGFETSKQVMQAANRAQDDANKSLLRSLRMGYTMRDQSQEIIQVLAKQTDKLYQIDKDLSQLDTELVRAKKDVMWFFRQLAGDKCCLMFLLVLLLGVIGLIFWSVYKKRKDGAAGIAGGTTSTSLTTVTGPTTQPPATTLGIIINF